MVFVSEGPGHIHRDIQRIRRTPFLTNIFLFLGVSIGGIYMPPSNTHTVDASQSLAIRWDTSSVNTTAICVCVTLRLRPERGPPRYRPVGESYCEHYSESMLLRLSSMRISHCGTADWDASGSRSELIAP